MKKFIGKWLKQGLINASQAQYMLGDIEKESSEKSSKKIILAFSLIGAALLGAGFLLFISANWQAIPAPVKVFMMSLITFTCAFGGYYLEFENKRYPRTGASLLFLSAIMFGALVFLTAQIYHLDSNRATHILVLIWLSGVLPYAYILRSRSVAALSCLLFVIWISAFFLTQNSSYKFVEEMPLVYFVSAVFIYAFAKVNGFFKAGIKTAGVFEKFGIFILYFAMFFMTFKYFIVSAPIQSALVLDILLISSIPMFLASFFFNPSKQKANTTEGFLGALIICFCINMYGSSLIPYDWLRIAANLIFAFLLIFLIYTGYKKEETFYVNTAIVWLIIFAAVKYFDFFWKLLPRSLFFLAGGIILVGASLFLEHKRRFINVKLKSGSGDAL